MDSPSCRERGLWVAELRGESLMGASGGGVQVPTATLSPWPSGASTSLVLGREFSELPPVPTAVPLGLSGHTEEEGPSSDLLNSQLVL